MRSIIRRLAMGSRRVPRWPPARFVVRRGAPLEALW